MKGSPTAETIVHVGLPKTATTSLQQGVFPNISGMTYLGKGLPSGESRGYLTGDLGVAITRVLYEDSVLVRSGSCPARALASAVAKSAAGRPVLLSAEEFVHPSVRDVGLVAERLADALPEAHILLTVRSQSTYLTSWWAHVGRAGKYLHHGRRFTRSAWRNLTPEEWWSQVVGSPQNDLDRVLDQFAVWKKYANLFDGRVTVLPLEWLTSSPQRYATVLAEVVGGQPDEIQERISGARFNVAPLAPNTGVDGQKRRWRRQPAAGARSATRQSGWLERSLSGVVYRLPMKSSEPAAFFEGVAQRYAESNELAAKNWGIDLRLLGYPMPSLSPLQT